MTFHRTILNSHLLVITVLLLIMVSAKAQKSIKYDQGEETYRKAIDLFEKQKFGSAQRAFEEVGDIWSDEHTEMSANAAYYRALCGLMLFNTNAENLLIEFITKYPESPKINRANFDLGKYQYRKKRYKKAISWFEQVDVYNLNNEDIAEYYFKLGYSYFQEGQNKQAMQSLFEIKDAETKYSVVAKYYYAHLAYETGNYETALTYFRQIEKQPSFLSVIPYYIAQILFKQAKYDELINYAVPILDSSLAQRASEISRLIGESYFNTSRFKEAIPFLITYVQTSPNAGPEDYFEIALACGKSDQLKESVKWFQAAISDNDSLNQFIHYNLGETFLSLDQKLLARNSMRSAYLAGSEPEIRESAMYSFAKLSYELSDYPYNDAIRALESYLNEYPNSANIEEANEFLVNVYFTTKNYEEARKSLDRIQNRSLKLNTAYQRILHYLGVEKLNRGELEHSIAYFDLVIGQDYDRKIKNEATFWRAEAYYRLLNYDESIAGYENFLFEPGAKSIDIYALAQYNLAYAHYRKREYDKAIFRFRQFVSNPGNANIKMVNDAYLRVADAYFVTREYKSASEYYQLAIDKGEFERDYAIFQCASALGVMGDYPGKILKLRQLTKEYQKSLYYDDALYELADVLLVQNKSEEALVIFEKLIIDIPESPYKSKALLKAGLISYNSEKDTTALSYFKEVVQNYRSTPEARQALDKIKNIYIDRGDLSGFEQYMSKIGIDDIPATSLDSAAYEIAENAYLNNQCPDAVKNFSIYIERYGQGLFLLNAHYYRGECEQRSGYDQEALLDFEYVLAQPKNLFTEKSLYHAARISLKLDQTEKAIAFYKALEEKADLATNVDLAQYWLMKLNFKNSNDNEGRSYALKVLDKENLSDEVRLETSVFLGSSYLRSDQFNKAYRAFASIASSNTDEGAKAKFNLAYIEYMRGNLDSSEKFIDMVLNQSPSYDLWIAKAFILWSDIYLAREDIYQAKVTLESVIQNYPGEDLKQLAKDKLEGINRLEEEKAEAIPKEKEAMEINFDEMGDYDFLFDEEIEE
ncbi:MAG: tetratricopeptide repeat protein [Vicingaceae bacterium]